jgi:hypothetical protein
MKCSVFVLKTAFRKHWSSRCCTLACSGSRVVNVISGFVGGIPTPVFDVLDEGSQLRQDLTPARVVQKNTRRRDGEARQ